MQKFLRLNKEKGLYPKYINPIPSYKVDMKMIDYIEKKLKANPEIEKIHNVQKKFADLNNDKEYLYHLKKVETTKSKRRMKKRKIKTKDLVNNYILERSKEINYNLDNIRLIPKEEMNPKLPEKIVKFIEQKVKEEDQNSLRMNAWDRYLY